MDVRERRIRTARVDLPGSSEVRLIRWAGDDGESGHLTVCVSWPEQPLGGRREDSVRIPAGAVPDLVRALKAMEA